MAGEKKTTQKRGDLGRVLVIGGNGFLGHHIVNQAIDSWNAKVTSIDLRCQKNRRPEAAYHECDITDLPRLQALFETIKPDVVIHTASPVATDSKIGNEIFYKVNVGGTEAVVKACQNTGVKALVYTSSASVISDNRSDLINADERWPVIRGAEQTEYYSETKAAAEELALKANREAPANLLTTSIRPAGIFGEGDAQVLFNLFKAERNGKTNVQIGDNTNLFDFTYVGNVAHAHLLAARLLLATAASSIAPLDHEKVDGEAFFITNDAPVYFWDFARAIWRAAGNKSGIDGVWTISRGTGLFLGSLVEIFSSIAGKSAAFTKHRAAFSTMTRYYNITKAKRILKYEPLWTLQEGVERGVAWFVEEEKKTSAKAQ